MMKVLLYILTLPLLCANVCHSCLPEQAWDGAVKPTQRYRLTLQGADPQYKFETTGQLYHEDYQCWTGKTITFRIPLDGGIQSVVFEDVTAHGPQAVSVFLNGQFLKGCFVNQQVPQQSIRVPFSESLTSPAIVTLEIPGACQPAKYDPNNVDQRELGLSLKTIAFYNFHTIRPADGRKVNIFTEPQRSNCANKIKNVGVRDTFPVDTIQQLRDLITGLEQDIQTYSKAKQINAKDIWLDQFSVLSLLQNRLAIASSTAKLVQELTNTWNPQDCETPNPNVIGSIIWDIFVDVKKLGVFLDNCPQGILQRDHFDLYDQAVKKSNELNQQQLQDLAANSDGLKKRYASEILDAQKIINSIISTQNGHETIRLNPDDEIADSNARAVYENHLISLSHLGINFQSTDNVYKELLVKELPIYFKIRRIQELIKTL